MIMMKGFFDECLCKLQARTLLRIRKLSRTTKLSRTMKKQIYNLLKKKFLYFTCVFITYNCIIDSCYLIKCKAKQKHLSPFYMTNNESKKFCTGNILYKWKIKIN